MWEDLTLKQKAEIMKMSVANGVTDIDDIKQFYNDSIKPEYVENISGGDVDSGPKATLINPIGPSVHRKNIGGHLFDKAGPKRNSKKKILGAYPNSLYQFVGQHESFIDTPMKDGKHHNQRSIGFGSNSLGAAGRDEYMRKIIGYGWKEIDAGRKMTWDEAIKLMTYDIEQVIKPQIRRDLGDKIYNSLTPGQLAAYVDTYYQSPTSGRRVAKVHRTQGAAAAGRIIGVKGYDTRNADRRAMFNGDISLDNLKEVSIENMSVGNTPMRRASNGNVGGGAAPMNMSLQGRSQSDPYLDYINSVKNGQPLAYTPVQTEKFVSPYTIVNEAVNNANGANDYFNMLLANKQSSQDYENAVKQQAQKQAIEYGLNLENNALWNNPYIMFGDNLAANGGRIL